ncbi:MAG: AAA family ATPase [Candidatus Paceibacterota bacterium]|jgi:cytidylate kinase
MNKKHIITIAGSLGSGKSSTAKRVAEMLGYQHFSAGDFFRAIAEKRGVSLVDLNKLAETDLSVDKEADDRNIEIGKMENVVLDSRLAFHFIPDSFKIFLEVNPIVAAKRILEDKKNNLNRSKESQNAFDTVENILDSISERLVLEKNRYKELYNIDDTTSHEHFDIIINTEKIPLEEVSKKVVEEYNNWLKQ